ncbi:RagB/SusD family nutrient uptake outer membrane protein [Pedobacter caeni]|uniref:Starch-binding associating with outer membrane n=1 Tax=Pedobacter caeni TaxID=288992 RepID=A0A1M5IPR2_9SPHI|nr:RagB/SusD family nutrient uptake outer membrane protein [Pedobacter caeni]SHG30216.1 Starch-binding associating with outer membrane [Pedobacter caeni]
MKTYNTCLTFSVLLLILMLSSCKRGFLDVVPDNVATIDHAFANRNEAEKFLFTCYSDLPQEGHPETNPGMNAGDEHWIYWPMSTSEDFWNLAPYNIARGLQNKNEPELNYWDSYSQRSLFQGIRNCNIFLENVGRVKDLEPYVKDRWVGEAKFLKAYLHWYLFRMYGPIPIIDKNLPITASPEEVKVSRQPVDSVVNYIANLLDEAASGEGSAGLPDKILNLTTELGRITKPAALAIKARLLVTAASPLFNGNTDLSNFKNHDQKQLFNSVYDPRKWTRAAEACRVAVLAAQNAGVKLYRFSSPTNAVDEATKIEMSIRNAVCEKWNSELIWGTTTRPEDTRVTQLYACPQLDPKAINLQLKGQLAPTMKMAELFYTENGVPINEDKTWDYANRFNLRTSTTADLGIQNGYQSVGLHFDREPRFYADMAFDGSKWFMQNGTFNIQSKSGQFGGKKQSRIFSVTGYYNKKLVNWNMVISTTAVVVESYPWPVMRLADLYLLYAEALNETDNKGLALEYLNMIRDRAGLKSVESSWTNFSTNPGKYADKTGLREIIRQERLIEMAFEGSRFWDLKRWKLAGVVLNEPIYGWDVIRSSYADYNRRVLLFNQSFNSPRDYFWPIKDNNLLVNPNLVQNPGW